MSNKPYVLLIRFFLELAGLLSIGIFGWQAGRGLLRFALATLLPFIAAAIWGTLRVPNDPGPAPVAVPGWLRLMIECLFFGFAALSLNLAGFTTYAILFGVIFLLLYTISYDRVLWLLNYK